MSDHVTFFFYVVKDYVHSSFMDWTGKTVTWCVLLLSPEYYKSMYMQITNLELLFISVMLSMLFWRGSARYDSNVTKVTQANHFHFQKVSKYPTQHNKLNKPNNGSKTKSGKIFSARINKGIYTCICIYSWKWKTSENYNNTQ